MAPPFFFHLKSSSGFLLFDGSFPLRQAPLFSRFAPGPDHVPTTSGSIFPSHVLILGPEPFIVLLPPPYCPKAPLHPANRDRCRPSNTISRKCSFSPLSPGPQAFPPSPLFLLPFPLKENCPDSPNSPPRFSPYASPPSATAFLHPLCLSQIHRSPSEAPLYISFPLIYSFLFPSPP